MLLRSEVRVVGAPHKRLSESHLRHVSSGRVLSLGIFPASRVGGPKYLPACDRHRRTVLDYRDGLHFFRREGRPFPHLQYPSSQLIDWSMKKAYLWSQG